ncbi:MAG: cytochrome c oxidase assembly protein [Pseudomonadota bacterium]|nr:cytochrome c oxidase assembly protein [Pseudomonadota bacterium]
MSNNGLDDPRRSNRVMLAKLSIIVVVMFGFGFALVPFYDQICKAMGLRDIDGPDEVKNTQVDMTRSVRLELDANASKLPWRFRPLTPIVNVHPGEVMQVVYEVENTSEHPVTGQAVPSYGPQVAAEYFRKLDCFCFTKQAFAPHEKRELPVVFVVDPKLPKDVATITLSYTFFEVEGNRT